MVSCMSDSNTRIFYLEESCLTLDWRLVDVTELTMTTREMRNKLRSITNRAMFVLIETRGGAVWYSLLDPTYSSWREVPRDDVPVIALTAYAVT